MFRKIKDIQDLKKFVLEHNSENESLEYKSSEILENLNDQSKRNLLEAVSAFANTRGGRIIIGVKEENKNKTKKYLLDEGVSLQNFDKNRLIDIIDGNLEPQINGLKVYLIKKNNKKGYFIIDIPEGITAYQNRIDKKYYGRLENENKPLADYWVRLLMNKINKPIFKVYLEATKRQLDNEPIWAFLLKIKNIGPQPSEKFTIYIKWDENVEIDCSRYIDASALIYMRRYIQKRLIIVSSSYHLGNQLILLPQEVITIKRYDGSDFFITFNNNSKSGRIYVDIYSENPVCQSFYIDISKIVNKLEEGKIFEMEDGPSQDN